MDSSSIDLIDRIYEAAFTPDLWEPTLDRLAAASGSAAGSFLVFRSPDSPPLYRATELTRPALAAFASSGAWRDSRRSAAMFDPRNAFLQGMRFFYASDHFEVAGDSVDQALAPLGLGAQITTVIPLPTGEIAALTFERLLGDGRHRPEQIVVLDSYWPHLARAGLMAARLRLEQARAATAALQAVGLPAAVLSGQGRVRAANTLFEAMDLLFLPTAYGGMAIADPAAHGMFLQAMKAAAEGNEPAVRSIPVRPAGERPPLVIHILPLRRSAHDIFSGGDLLVAATVVCAGSQAPSPSVLSGLFDLAPAEARLAAALTRGQSLKDFAAEAGITFTTARKYLDHVYAKTGTHRQNELVALLKGAQPLGPAG